MFYLDNLKLKELFALLLVLLDVVSKVSGKKRKALFWYKIGALSHHYQLTGEKAENWNDAENRCSLIDRDASLGVFGYKQSRIVSEHLKSEYKRLKINEGKS